MEKFKDQEEVLFRGYDLNKCSRSVLATLANFVRYYKSENTAFFYIRCGTCYICIDRNITKSYFETLKKRSKFVYEEV